MEDFLLVLHDYCDQLLPIFGAIALLVLIIVLIKLVSLLGNVNVTLKKVHPSIDLVEKTLDKVQAPVDTVVKVSKGVDKAYDSSVKAIDSAKKYVAKNAGALKTKVNELVKKESKDEIDYDDISKGE